MHHLSKTLVEKWCLATVNDAVRMFHNARVHPDNEAEELANIAKRCANSAFQDVAQYIVGDRDSTAKRYGELCYARFKREIEKVILEKTKVEEFVC